MAKIEKVTLNEQQFKKLTADYPEVAELISAVNAMFTKVDKITSKGIGQENLNQTVKEVRHEPGDDARKRVQIIDSGLQGKVIGVNVISIYDISKGKDDPKQSDVRISVDWKPIGSKIKISGFPGIDDGKTFLIKLLLIGE